MSILENLGLSQAERDARRGFIGGSDANIIMGGDPARLIALWREKRGEREPESLADILAVQMGSFTEPLNRAWFEKQTGRSVVPPEKLVRGGVCEGPEPFMRCSLDGIVEEVVDPFDERLVQDVEAVFEAKHCGTRSTDAEIFARYVPQLTHNCLCAGMRVAFLSVFKGNGDWMQLEYEIDDDYAERLVAAEHAFWRCVETGEPPVPLPPEPTPKPKGVKIVDMTGSNEWGSHAAQYLETVLAADRHEIAKKSLKSLVPDDASKCFGHGIAINRDKRGALRFANAGE